MTKPTSKNSRSKDSTKGEGLSKCFIQKMAEELQAIQASKLSNA